MSIRYYVYIGDTKVDMMLPQIDPGFAHSRETEVRAGVSLVGATRKVAKAVPDRVARLERVVRHLQDHMDIGTPDAPGAYFAGILPARMLVQSPDSVYFGGATETTEIGLGGSASHLVTPSMPASEEIPMGSHMPGILRVLAAVSETGETAEEPGLADDVHQANRRIRGPLQNIEVLAKLLAYEPGAHDGNAVVVGSPIYVALAD
ncbi:DUF7019 family protein [Salininema proteolyticum]|uniref:DUF7019 family protein n=1 Tax=Salininema proteolyticum TaxID=1607685 RepID=A0ABV8TWF8_9ACTN